MSKESLCWVHVGDLHITEAQRQNYQDLIKIVEVINEHFTGFADFCVLPGDNADDGTPEQYALIRSAIKRLKIPLHVIPGDHDFKQGSLSSFYDGLGGAALPKSLTVKGHRCLFLDAVSEGGGGADFHASSARIVKCRYRIDDGRWHELARPQPDGEWTASDERPSHRFLLTVEATDSEGSIGTDCIRVAESAYRAPSRAADGSDADAIDAWPERHLLGTRLGPNRNGKQW